MATQVTTPTAAAAPRGRTRRPRPIPEGGRVNWGLTAVIALVSLIVLIPLYFAVAMALKSPAQTGTGTGFNFPWPMHWGNFRAAWDLTNTPLAFSMSLLITVIAVAGEIFVSSLAAWAIVRNWDHWQFRATFVYLLLALFILLPAHGAPIGLSLVLALLVAALLRANNRKKTATWACLILLLLPGALLAFYLLDRPEMRGAIWTYPALLVPLIVLTVVGWKKTALRLLIPSIHPDPFSPPIFPFHHIVIT